MQKSWTYDKTWNKHHWTNILGNRKDPEDSQNAFTITSSKISLYIPVQIGPERGWGPHFVATERRPQGALLTSWQNPTFTEEGFCYKMAVQADP